MIKFYYSGAPNPTKIALMLEECGLPYEPIAVDTRKGDQHKPDFLAINPNAKVPAIVDGDATVFDSSACLLYLAEKTGKFLPAKSDKARGELLHPDMDTFFTEQRKLIRQREQVEGLRASAIERQREFDALAAKRRLLVGQIEAHRAKAAIVTATLAADNHQEICANDWFGTQLASIAEIGTMLNGAKVAKEFITTKLLPRLEAELMALDTKIAAFNTPAGKMAHCS